MRTREEVLNIVCELSADYILRGDAIEKMSIDGLPSDQVNALRTIIAALQPNNAEEKP
ncbi:MAG: hypothetical protein IKQ80_00235 [Clostridia bacterium]|nr:hypothetical protein [Clostridia bacterium]